MSVSVTLYPVSSEQDLRSRLQGEGFVPVGKISLPAGVFSCLALVAGLSSADIFSVAAATARRGDLTILQGRFSAGGDDALALITGPALLRSLARCGRLPGKLSTELNRALDVSALRSRQISGCRRVLRLERPGVMGILNVTPDSFYTESRQWRLDQALRQGERLAAEGADVIDVGGESTRPGAASVSLDQELERVVPVIERLARELDCPLSVDTSKSRVAAAAVAAGADFVNDISGLQFDPAMARVVAESEAGLFLMHTRGSPREMQLDTDYVDLLGEVAARLGEAIDRSLAAGVRQDRLAVDPGIGFGKSVEGNLTLLRHLKSLHGLGCPLLLGTSRKSFIGRVLGLADPALRLSGSLATVALGVAAGVQLFRVHDVRATREAALMAWAICHEQLP